MIVIRFHERKSYHNVAVIFKSEFFAVRFEMDRASLAKCGKFFETALEACENDSSQNPHMWEIELPQDFYIDDVTILLNYFRVCLYGSNTDYKVCPIVDLPHKEQLFKVKYETSRKELISTKIRMYGRTWSVAIHPNRLDTPDFIGVYVDSEDVITDDRKRLFINNSECPWLVEFSVLHSTDASRNIEHRLPSTSLVGETSTGKHKAIEKNGVEEWLDEKGEFTIQISVAQGQLPNLNKLGNDEIINMVTENRLNFNNVSLANLLKPIHYFDNYRVLPQIVKILETHLEKNPHSALYVFQQCEIFLPQVANHCVELYFATVHFPASVIPQNLLSTLSDKWKTEFALRFLIRSSAERELFNQSRRPPPLLKSNV